MDKTTYGITSHHAQVCHLSNSLQVAEGITDDIQVFVLFIGVPPHLQPVILCMAQHELWDPEEIYMQVHKSPMVHVCTYCISDRTDLNRISPS